MKSRIQKYRVPLSIAFASVLLIFLLLSRSAWEKQEPIVAGVLFLAGVILVGIATLGRVWCSLYIAGHKTKHLVTEGPYSISRNPLYFLSLVGCIGVGLCSETILIPVILLIAFVLYYPGVMSREEARLREVHGEAFEQYIAATPRFFPSISRFREPESYVVNPRLYRREVFRALWFVWLVGLLEIIEQAHELGYLPSLWSIY